MEAAERFADDLGPGGPVKTMSGSAMVEGMSLDMEIEIGSNDATRITVDAGMFVVVMTCVGDHVFVSFGGDVYESRPDSETCDLEIDEGPDVPLMEGSDWEVVEIEERDDGSLEAVLRVTEDGEEEMFTVVVTDGRIVELTIDDEDGSMTFLIDYGSRSVIEAPDADGRLPASVEWSDDFTPGSYEGTITEVDAVAAPVGEFEIQILEYDDEYQEQVLASFPLDDPGTQSQGGFGFVFEDDGDGFLSAGDRFQIENPDWEHGWDHEVAFYDSWAGMRTDESPMPAPGLAWLVLALVGAAPLLGRLRRTPPVA